MARVPDTPHALEVQFRRVLWYCNGKQWPLLFSRMNSGRMDTTTGLAVIATSLGFIDFMDRPKRRRKSEKVAPSPDDASTMTLGPSSSLYIYHDPSSVFAQATSLLFEAYWALAVEACSVLRWPAAPAEVPAFADQLFEFAKKIRREIREAGGVEFGLVGGRSPKFEYSARHFVRAMLLQVEDMFPNAFDDIVYGEMSDWLPDVLDHTRPLESMTGAQIRTRFDMSPLMVGCWACLADSINGAEKTSNEARHSAELKAVLAANDAWLWPAVGQYVYAKQRCKREVDPDIFPPGPAIVWDQKNIDC